MDTAKTNDDYRTVKITVYDKMYRLSEPYTTALTYPALIADVVTEFGGLIGGNGVVKPETFPALHIQRKVEDGKYTMRDMAGHLAGCLGRNARYNRDGDMEFVFYEPTAVKAVEELQYMRGFEKLADNALKIDFLVTGTEDEPIELENDGSDPGEFPWYLFDSSNPDDFPWLAFTYDDATLTASVQIAEGYTSRTEGIKIPYSLATRGNVYNVTSIPASGFANCSMEAIMLPESLETIGNSAFESCTKITELTIPWSVTSLGGRLIEGCSALSAIYYNAENATLPVSSSFPFYCTNATGNTDISLIIGASVKVIPASVFINACKVNYLYISDGVETIGKSAFQNCTGITTVTIPASVTSIGTSAFEGCSALQFAFVEGNIATVPSNCFDGCSALGSVSLPATVTLIDSYAFSGCSKLAEITIPGLVTRIKNYAFQNCASLTSVVIPDSVTQIDYYCFKNCTGLTSVQIGTSSDCKISTIKSSVFNGCSNITSIVIYKATDSVDDSPWGASFATISWLG